MSTFVVLFALAFVFGVGLAAGVAVSRAGVRVDQVLARFDRDQAVNDAADMDEHR